MTKTVWSFYLAVFIGFTLSCVAEVAGSNDSDECPPNCDIECLCGQVKDEDGCTLCRCKTCDDDIDHPTCPPLPCILTPKCPYGVKREKGCPQCECVEYPDHCPSLNCSIPTDCQHGVVTTEGCPTCDCKPDENFCQELPCLSRMVCRFGIRVVDKCPTCSCNKPPACPSLLCIFRRSACYVGIRIVNGCPQCYCKRRRRKFVIIRG